MAASDVLKVRRYELGGVTEIFRVVEVDLQASRTPTVGFDDHARWASAGKPNSDIAKW
jgi:hypothetical protein